MNLKNPNKYIKALIIKAGRSTLRHFGKKLKAKMKEDRNDLVTRADYESERIIKEALRRRFPSHGIVSEESLDNTPDKEYVWYVDPLDATWNFAHKMPIYGVTITLVHNQKPEMTWVYLPYIEDFYFAQRGKGAYLNGKKIICSDHPYLIDSVGHISSQWTKKKMEKLTKNILQAAKHKKIILLSMGCACYTFSSIADGNMDWVIGQGGKVWDYLPGYMLMKEAGCKVTNIDGKDWTLQGNGIVAANPALHSKVIRLIR